MQTGPAGFATWIAEQTHQPVQSFTIDYGDGAGPVAIDGVTHFEVDRQLATDMPPETRLVAGYSSSMLTIDIEGNDSPDADPAQGPSWKYSPVNAASPLYNKKRLARAIAARAGLRTPDGVMDVPAFTGRTRINTVNDDGTDKVTFSTQDNWELLRGTVDLPVAFNESPLVTASTTVLPQCPGLNSRWVIEEVLRQSGVLVCPPEWGNSNTFLKVSYHGSALPDQGMGASLLSAGTRLDFAPKGPGYHLSGGGYLIGIAGYEPLQFASGGQYGAYWNTGRTWDWSTTGPDAGSIGGTIRRVPTANYRIASSRGAAGALSTKDGNKVQFEGWLYFDPAALASDTVQFDIKLTSASGAEYVDFFVSSFEVVTSFQRNGDIIRSGAVLSAGLPISAGWHYITASVVFSATRADFSWTVDTTTATAAVTGIPGGAASPPALTRVTVAANSWVGVEALQVGRGPAGGDVNHRTWTSQADLDLGFNELSFIPDVDGAIAADVIREVVAAEYGTFEFTESGRPVFRNRDRWRSFPAAPQATLDSKTNLYALQIEEAIDSVRNQISGKAHIKTLSVPSIVWRSDTVLTISARKVTDFIVDLGEQVTAFENLDGTDTASASATALDTANGAGRNVVFALNPAADGTAPSLGPYNVLVTVTPIAGSIVKISFDNRMSTTLYTVNSSGVPTIGVWGRIVVDQVDQTLMVEDTSSQADWGKQAFDLPDSGWVQDLDSLQLIANSLLRDLKTPAPVIHEVDIVPDYRLQLGDYVKLQHDRVGLADTYWVVGVNLSGDSSGHVMKVTLRTAAPRTGWLLGIPGRSEVGVTTQI